MNNFQKQELINPERLLKQLPMTPQALKTVLETRHAIQSILANKDPRYLIIAGPCSIHDIQSALEYGKLIKEFGQQFKNKLLIVMRTYFEKPRTTIGWKGLISDPDLNGSHDINKGLYLARELLLELNELGIPTATEFLDNVIPSYLEDLISWCAVGARTSESPFHRELASGFQMPVGFKNSTDGNVQIAIDAVEAAAHSHHLLTFSHQGTPIIKKTPGNKYSHIILRGSSQKPNYFQNDVQEAAAKLREKKLNARIMIDCSHGNSMKNYKNQQQVFQTICEDIKNGSKEIFGMMLESNLVEGRQNFTASNPLIYGQSITDACLSWEQTKELLRKHYEY